MTIFERLWRFLGPPDPPIHWCAYCKHWFSGDTYAHDCPGILHIDGNMIANQDDQPIPDWEYPADGRNPVMIGMEAMN